MIRQYSHVLAVITTCMALTLLAGCGGGGSPTKPTTPTPPPPPPPTPVATTITVTPSSHTLGSIGATVQLTATVKDKNNNTMSGQTVTWTSGNMAVATVNAQGLVTAASNGTAQITARSGNASGRATVTVAEPVPTRIAITPSSRTLEAIGDTVQLRAAVRDQRNNAVSGETIAWSSGDDAVATVSEEGLVTAVSNGMVDITAQSGSLSSNATITVAQVPESILIAVDPDSTPLTEMGQTLQLTASVSDANDVPIDDALVTWSSSNESVATVDEEGLVTAVGSGMADITATAGEVSQSVAVTVMIPSPDREPLIALYNATDGPNWTRQDNWLSEAPISTWYGITTNVVDRVTKIHLTAVGMTGSIPAVLGQLAHLDSLIISGNNGLTGSIPAELGQLQRLDVMNLSGNTLTGTIPPELGQLTRLKEMYLSVNKLSGDLPPELGQMSNMEWLFLGRNEFTGPIPPELGNLSNLVRFNLSRNNLAGEIPAEFGQFPDLVLLDLSENKLSGSLPDELGQLRILAFLMLENNPDLSGSLPGTFLDLERLQILRLSGTQICVPPTADFRIWLSGISDPLQGAIDLNEITYCEIEYLPWTGLMVSPGKLAFVTDALPVPFELTTCFPLNNFEFMGASITVYEAKWQWRTDMDSPWMDLEDTIVTFQVCPLSPDEPGDYRLVGDATIQGERGFYASENYFTIE